MQLSMSGKGNDAPGGETPGDLLILIEESEDEEEEPEEEGSEDTAPPIRAGSMQETATLRRKIRGLKISSC